ncbi:uncharacterized protein TNCV_1980071 [Trichonephila clavipes]|nr:uncharacterized protein TNCV_1980071 [Trichonephila clavipes]
MLNLHISCKDSGNQTTRSGKLDDLYIGFQLIRWLPQEFQSTVQQIYRWKEEDFRVVKIEAELILEANRLQLMKQDLEKAENAYLSSFTSKKSKTLPGATAAAHGDPNGKNDYQKKGELDKQLVTSCILFEENSDKGVWVIDTAATSHFCNDKSLFLDLKPITNMKMSLATQDKSCPVEGIGTLRFRTKPEQPDEDETYKEKLDLQLRKDICYTLIYTNISSDLKNLITETTDGLAAWKILKDHFEPVTRARIIQLLDQFLEQNTNQGRCWNLHISCKDSGKQTTGSGWKEEDFRVVKIEAELILEANRLQLMKQDLEKAEKAYLSSFTSKKSKTLPGATAAAHGDPNGKNDYQKKSDGKKRTSELSKIEAELILEANRLQLMKQDLEKAENAYLSSFTSKKSKTLPGATAAAHGRSKWQE